MAGSQETTEGRKDAWSSLDFTSPSPTLAAPMGLFDSLAKNALGSMLGGSAKMDPAAMLSGLLNEAGGLNGMMAQFEKAGLSEIFSSWVGTGTNLPINAEQMKAAVGEENLQALAGKVGMHVHTVQPLLTQFLPQIIDKLTPQGHIHDNNPSGSQIQSVLTSVISSGLGGLFGGGR
ncbi:YidB family protein [Prosthecobacter sp.]|uniref:YidB family protein n=1 Tax=Prosthecobacter sp. TaxID=1965333 RepID=UPI0037CB4C3B